MFGNKTGWLLSAVMVLLTGGLIYLLHQANQPDPPTYVGQNAASYKFDLPVDPAPLADWMTEDRDATEQYRAALDDLVDRTQYSDFERNFNASRYISRDPNKRVEPPPKIKGVEFLVQARTAKRAAIFSGQYKELLSYTVDPNEGPPRQLQKLGELANRMGVIHQHYGRKQEARPYFEAAFSLGLRLYQERLTWQEADAGLGVMGVGAYALKELADEEKDSAASQRWDEFMKAKNAFYNGPMVMDKARGIYPVLYRLNNPHVGNLVALARNGGDRMWRVEAIWALGRAKFVSDGRGNQLGAKRTLRMLANDGSLSEVERFAAQVARDAPWDDVQQQGR
jgi:hypothetical protein